MSDLSYSSIGFTDIGRVRQENQDAFYIDNIENIYIVADGMGGMQDGALASKYVIKELPILIKQEITQLSERNEKNLSSLLMKGISELSNDLCNNLGSISGSTVVLVLFQGKNAFVAHLGDSRAYLFRGGILERLTSDHNVANVLVKNGIITAEDARVHPMRHVLTNYVGRQGENNPEVTLINIQPGDRILLCTDGLTGMIAENSIENVLGYEQNPKMVLNKLISEANKAGGYDNITCLLIDVKEKEIKK